MEGELERDRLWLMTGSIPTGPFDPAQVHAKLASSEVSWDTLACPVGGADWRPLVDVPGFGPTAVVDRESVSTPAPSRPPEPVSGLQVGTSTSTSSEAGDQPPTAIPVVVLEQPGRAVSTSPPWSPVAIAWLGVLFSPAWAGVMAALNGRRLAAGSPARLPLAIGFGSLLANCVANVAADYYVIHLGLYIGALALLWHTVLRHQVPLFAAFRDTRGGGSARWVWPSVAGAPLALCSFFVLVIVPLIPLEPRQVCERFNAATTAEEALSYTTQNLAPAVTAGFARKGRGEDVTFELTDEAPAPTEVGGYFVSYRLILAPSGGQGRVEGVFHLVNFTGEWKIEDIYVTTVDRQELAPWVRYSTDYAAILQLSARPTGLASSSVSPDANGTGAHGKEWTQDPNVRRLAARGLVHWLFTGGKKAAGLLVLVLAGGVSAVWRAVAGGGTPQPREPAGTTPNPDDGREG